MRLMHGVLKMTQASKINPEYKQAAEEEINIEFFRPDIGALVEDTISATENWERVNNLEPELHVLRFDFGRQAGHTHSVQTLKGFYNDAEEDSAVSVDYDPRYQGGHTLGEAGQEVEDRSAVKYVFVDRSAGKVKVKQSEILSFFPNTKFIVFLG